MAYGVLYEFRRTSSNGADMLITISQKDYTGAVKKRALGRAPVIKRENNDHIYGTSCELYAECLVDGEFSHLYTSDAYEFKVEVYKNNILLWAGFVSPELYSEPDIAPPYDVQIIATDGLGELKNYNFKKRGVASILDHLDTLMANTGLGMDFYVVSGLRYINADGTASEEKDILSVKLDLDHEEGNSCYEVLQGLLSSLNANITQHNGRYLIFRETDFISKASATGVEAFSESGSKINLPIAGFGSMKSNQWWPVGQLSTVIEPAKNHLTLKSPNHYKENVLSFDNWSLSGLASYSETDNAYVLPGADSAITQTVNFGDHEVGYRLGLRVRARNVGTPGDEEQNIGIKVEVNGRSYSVGKTFWLVKSVNTSGRPINDYLFRNTEGYIEEDLPTPTEDATSSDAQDIDIVVPLHASGNRSYVYAKNVKLTIFNPTGLYDIHVYDVSLVKYEQIKGYEANVIIENMARESESDIDLTITAGDLAPAAGDVFMTGLPMRSSDSEVITKWQIGLDQAQDYLAAMAFDYSRAISLPRMKYSGTLNVPESATILPTLFLRDGTYYFPRTYSYDLYADEITIDLISISAADVSLSSVQISQTSEAAGTMGTTTGGPAGGGSPSAKSLAQLDDVRISNPAVGDIFAFGGKEWENMSFQKVVNEYLPLLKTLGDWFYKTDDGLSIGTKYNLFSEQEMSANGLSVGPGGSGSGLISQVYGITAFGTIAAESNSATFNAYAIDSLYKRIVSLEGKATAVSFVPAMTSGKQIGTLSIDGVSTVLYGVDAYSKTDADGTFLKLSGGTVTGNLNVLHKTSVIPLLVENKAQNYTAIAFRGANSNTAYLVYSGTGDTWEVTNVNWNRTSALLHANNYSQYALPLTGGTISGNTYIPLKVVGTSVRTSIGFSKDASAFAYLTYNGGSSWAVTNEYYNNEYTLYHSGNFNPANYLPVNGGAIGAGNSNSFPLTISSTSAYTGIAFATSGGTAYFRYQGGSNWGVTDNGWNNSYTLIHSGNVGSQSVDKATRLFSGNSLTDLNEALFSDLSLRYYSALSSETLNIPDKTGWQNALLALPLHGNGVTAQFYFTANSSQQLYYRSTQVNAWKIIAFTDSNVASAQALSNANGTVAMSVGTSADLYVTKGKSLFLAKDGEGIYFGDNGIFWHNASNVWTKTSMVFNSSGNVTIGSSDLAGTSAKLYVDGSVYVGNRKVLERVSNNLHIGEGIRDSYDTSVFGTNILFNTSSGNNAMMIAIGGNIGIGTTTNISSRLTIAATTTSEPTIAVDNHCKILGISNLRSNWLQREILSSGWDSSRGDVLYLRTPSSQETSPYIFMQREGLRVGVNTNTPKYTLDVNGDIASSGALRMGLNSAYGAYLQTNDEGGWTGIYSANKGNWQATNMYLMPDGDVRFAHAARVIGKNTNGDTGLFVEGTQYSMWFGIGSGNVNRGIFDINNNGWWIYRGSDTLTRISGGIETSTGSFTGAVTMSSTLHVVGVSTFESYLNIQAGIRPNANDARYVGTSSYRFNEGYINNMYTNAMYVGKGTTYGFKSDGSINATLINATNDIITSARLYAPQLFLGRSAEGIYLTSNSISWHNSSNNWASSLMGFTSTSIIAHQSITANSGVKVASGQALTFLDASGKEHKLTYDSTAGAFKFDGNILVLGDGQFNAIN